VRHAEIRRLALALLEAARVLKTNKAELTAIVNDLAPGLTHRCGIGRWRLLIWWWERTVEMVELAARWRGFGQAARVLAARVFRSGCGTWLISSCRPS
jgi:hypothetical protein